jgi:hypothetical protein
MALVNALTTLANAKTIAGISLSNTAYDAMFELLVNRVSASVRGYVGRELTRQTITEQLHGNNRQFLLLKECPIASVISVTDNGKLLVLNTDYRMDMQDAQSGRLYKIDGWNALTIGSGLTMDIMASARSITVVYAAGYYLPDNPLYVAGSAASLPFDLQGIVEEIIAERYFKTTRKSTGLNSYSEGGISFGFDNGKANSTALGFSDEQVAVLNNYRKVVVV